MADYDDTYGGYRSLPSNTWKDDDDALGSIKPRKLSAHDPAWDEDDYAFPEDDVPEFVVEPSDLLEIVMGADAEALSDLLEQVPETTINILCNVLACAGTQWTTTKDMSALEVSIYQSFLAGDTVALLDAVDNGLHGNVADVACYYMNWSHKLALV